MAVCMDGKTLLEDKEYECIVHAFGLTRRGGRGRFGRRWAYRNYFAAGGRDVEIWRHLTERGFAVERSVKPLVGDPVFHVTRAGARAADVVKYIPRDLGFPDEIEGPSSGT